MRPRRGQGPSVVDDRGLGALVGQPGFRVELSLEGFPRLRCRLPATWDTGERRLDHHLLYAVFSGAMAVSWASGETSVAAGDALLVPPGVAFRSRAGSGAVRLARLRFGLGGPGRPVAWGSAPRAWRAVEGIEPVLTVAEELLLRPRQDRAEHQAAFVLLLGALRRSGAAGGLTPAQLAGLRRQVATDPSCAPADLARGLGLSHDYATRLIGRSVGVPPRAFILRERLALAADRLAAGGAAPAVAAGLGWRDHKLFLRQFRAAFGLPPGRWLRHLA